MKFEAIKPGDVVYDVGTGNMGNTTLKTVRVWPVKVISIDDYKRTVLASWNSNPPMLFHEKSYKKWRVNRPMLIPTLLGGNRLATRDEIKSARMKAAE